MKKLLLLIAITSFYNVSAMEQPSLTQDLNAQDRQGNTPLHNAVIAWEKSKKSAEEKAKEYAHIGEQCKQIKREINAKQSKSREKNSTLEALDAQHKALFEKAKTVKSEHALHKKQTDSHKKAAIQLIINGSSINTPNLNHKTVAELCPHLIEEIVYNPLWRAIVDGDIPTMQMYLRIGADPELKDRDEMTALQFSINGNKPESAKELLLYGAKLTTKIRFGGRGAMTALHLAANRGTSKMVETLLYSPQASPSFYSSTYNDSKTKQEMFTFLCCMNRNRDSLPAIPAEIVHNVYKFMLPDTAALINQVPLQQLPYYKKFLGKTTLINALVKRHMEIVGNALTIKSDVNVGAIITLPPHQFPRLSLFDGIDLLKDEKAVRRALDPANLEEHRETIEANYTKLLE